MDECRFPPPISDDQLEAFIDGSHTPDVQRHLAGCPFCSSRLHEIRGFELTLRRSLYRWTCPELEELTNYEFGLLLPEQVAALVAHLEECAPCREELEGLRKFLQDSHSA
jgi:hypothetical protein